MKCWKTVDERREGSWSIFNLQIPFAKKKLYAGEKIDCAKLLLEILFELCKRFFKIRTNIFRFIVRYIFKDETFPFDRCNVKQLGSVWLEKWDHQRRGPLIKTFFEEKKQTFLFLSKFTTLSSCRHVAIEKIYKDLINFLFRMIPLRWNLKFLFYRSC